MRPVDCPPTSGPADPSAPADLPRTPEGDQLPVASEPRGSGPAARRTVLRSLAVAGAGAGLTALAYPAGSPYRHSETRAMVQTGAASVSGGNPLTTASSPSASGVAVGSPAPAAMPRASAKAPAPAAMTSASPTAASAGDPPAATTLTSTVDSPAATVRSSQTGAVETAPASTSSPAKRVAPNSTGTLSVPDQVFTGFAVVAAATTPTNPGVFVTDPALHLLRRCTFGPRPSDVASVRKIGIDAWLTRQLNHTHVPDQAGRAAWALFPLAGATPDVVRKNIKKHSWDAMVATAMATLGRQIFSDRQLYEVVVDVFSDHLHVALPGVAWDTSSSYLVDVIRPFAMGRYRDMLLAALRHPAMLQYLDNDVSTKQHVNENLGRELLELHTVGAGYTEAEVVASAKVLTGRTVDGLGRFFYRSGDHYVGPLTVMGWSSPNRAAEGGLAVGDSYLTYLANHPSTARMIARKLAVRFVSDQPSAALLDAMAQSYLDNDTDIRAVLVTLFRSPEFWASVGQKSRRPLEDLVGGARVLDMVLGPKPADAAKTVETLYWVVRANGHAPLGWVPPNGYPDVAAAWNNAGSLVARWTMHRALANKWWNGGITQASPKELVPVPAAMTAGQWVDALSLRLLGQPMAPAHRDAVLAFARVDASSPVKKALDQAWGAVPLLLDSPYFQLR